MTDEEKRVLRKDLKTIRDKMNSSINDIDIQISNLCHRFTEDELLSLGWVRSHYSGPYMAYGYKQNDKIIVFLDKSGTVLSYSGKQTKSFEDVQELIDYLSE